MIRVGADRQLPV